MAKVIAATFALLISSSLQAQAPLTQVQACEKFSSAVVRIEAGGKSIGTGFLVSEDGYILTAAHVVRDTTGRYFSTIAVSLPNGMTAFPSPLAMTHESVGQDFAILKVDGESNLPFIQLANSEDMKLGSEATIIGYPFSALTTHDKNVSAKFCLSAQVAAFDFLTEPITIIAPNGQATKRDVHIDVIYFQGPSVKGISGSPLISRETGHVLGIVTQKLTGIGPFLSELKEQTGRGVGGGVEIRGLNPGIAINQVITVLDNQLANGLGAATGIGDPAIALERARRTPR